MGFGQLPLFTMGGASPPTITALNYAYFDSLGGDALTITGTGLAGATIKIGGTTASVSSSGSTSLTFTTPAKAAGATTIVATNSGLSSSGFTIESINMTTIGTLDHWLRSSLGLTQSSGTVSSWADQSGNGFDMTLSNASFPHWTSSDADFGGKASIGNSSTSTNETRDIKSTTTWSFAGPSMVYWVFRVYGSGSSFNSMNRGGSGASDTANAHWIIARPTAGGGTLYGNDGLFLSGNYLSNSTTYVACANISTSGALYLNDSSVNVSGSGNFGTTADTGLSLGCSGSGIWRMTEHMHFSGTHTTERQKIMVALGAKYGVATS